MTQPVETLLTHYESGRMSRRDLVALLTALAAAPLPAAAQPDALKAATLNHASLIVSDLDRSVAFYQRAFGLPVKSTQQGGVNLAVGDAFLGIYQAGPNAVPHINHFCFGIRNFDPAATVAGARSARIGRGIPHARRRDAGVHRRSRQLAHPIPRRELLRRRRRARQRVPRVRDAGGA